MLHLTPDFNTLRKDNCKTRRKTFRLWDLARLILESWRYIYLFSYQRWQRSCWTSASTTRRARISWSPTSPWALTLSLWTMRTHAHTGGKTTTMLMILVSLLWSAPAQTVGQTIRTPAIWDAIALIMTSLWYILQQPIRRTTSYGLWSFPI